MTIRLCCIIVLLTACSTPKNFQIQCVSVSADATYIVDIVVEGKKQLKNLEIVKLDAIDGILFRGINGSNCVSQKPLINFSKEEVKYNRLIQSIYGSKKGYRNYISSINTLKVDQVSNLSRPITQFTYRVSVNKGLLMSDLISAGIIKPLNSGF